MNTTDLQAQYRKVRDLYRQIIAQVPGFVFVLSESGIYLDVKSDDPSRLWMPTEQHFGKTLEAVLPPYLLEQRRFYFDRAAQGLGTQRYDQSGEFRSKEFDFSITVQPIVGSEEILVIVRDKVCHQSFRKSATESLH